MALNSATYITPENMALILKYGDADEGEVAGLDNIGLPGVSRAIVEVKVFREYISRQYATGGKMGNITFSGTYTEQDTNGYDQLFTYFIANTKFTDTRVYMNYEDFLTVDIAQDADAAFQVAELNKDAADSNDVIRHNGVIVLNGLFAVFFAHTETMSSTVTTPVLGEALHFVMGSGTVDTITDDDSAFVTDGFVDGQSLLIEGSTSNDAVLTTITTVAAGTLTLASEGSLTTEDGLAATILHGGKLG